MLKEDLIRAKQSALRLLARREHSRVELQDKLQQRGFVRELIEQVLQEVIAQGWQSDARFAEVYVNHRLQQGYGPLRVHAELRARGIAEETIEQYIEVDWLTALMKFARKKFGKLHLAKDFVTRAKQLRTLQQRGFTMEQIKQCFDAPSS